MVGKLGVARFNPLLFALIREAVAGPLLLLLALACDGWLMPRREEPSQVVSSEFWHLAGFVFSVCRLAFALAGQAGWLV